MRNRRGSNSRGPRTSGCRSTAPESSRASAPCRGSRRSRGLATLSLSSNSCAANLSGSFLDGAGVLGVPCIAKIRSLFHRSSSGTRNIVRHLTASPEGTMTTCSPVRLTCPTHTALTDLASNFFLCLDSILPVRRVANFANTTSPISTAGRCHLLPVRRSQGTMPSCPTEYRVSKNGACM